LVRYGEEGKNQIKVKPEYVVVACIAVVVLEVILRSFG